MKYVYSFLITLTGCLAALFVYSYINYDENECEPEYCYQEDFTADELRDQYGNWHEKRLDR